MNAVVTALGHDFPSEPLRRTERPLAGFPAQVLSMTFRQYPGRLDLCVKSRDAELRLPEPRLVLVDIEQFMSSAEMGLVDAAAPVH